MQNNGGGGRLLVRAAAGGGSGVSYVADVLDPTISTLLHMNGSNGSTTFTDDSYVAKTFTTYGNAQISNTQSKFGGTSGYFDASAGTRIVSSNSADYAMSTGDFTFECWLYLNSYGTGGYSDFAGTIFDTRSSGGSGAGVLFIFGSTGHLRTWNGSLHSESTGSPVPLNAWSHIAFVRKLGILTYYIDGVACGSFSLATNFSDQYLCIGRPVDANILQLDGYMDEVRISKANARYSTTFTPSVAAFLNAFNSAALPASPVVGQLVLSDASMFICTNATGPVWKGYSLTPL
jgi:hypothetical protein